MFVVLTLSCRCTVAGSSIAMDVINLSLGSGSDYRSSPLAVVADILNGKGVSVVAAAGNSGDDVSSPSWILVHTLL
jgi:subtilisin family serine protease